MLWFLILPLSYSAAGLSRSFGDRPLPILIKVPSKRSWPSHSHRLHRNIDCKEKKGGGESIKARLHYKKNLTFQWSHGGQLDGRQYIYVTAIHNYQPPSARTLSLVLGSHTQCCLWTFNLCPWLLPVERTLS